MRTFRRLFPVLALVLLTVVVLAKPAGPAQTSQAPGIFVVQPQAYSGLGNPPNPRLYFGTVVRDTADGEYVGHRGGPPSILPPQEPQYLLMWISFVTRSWVGLPMIPK